MKRSTRIIRWIETHLVVPEGKFVGQPVKLREFQKRWIRKIYDTPTRMVIISVGRKNAKTALAAFLLLVHLCGPEARQNSQLISAAQSREQAALLFDLARKCVRLSPTLSEFVTIRDSAKQLLCPELGTVYKAMSAEASTAYGISPVFTVHDELGQVKGPASKLYDAIETSMGAQEAPLSIVISTQAPNDGDLLSTMIDDAQSLPDPLTKLILHTADEELDPFSREAQKQANPALGDFLDADEVMRQAKAAERMPSREPSYRNLVLNQRVNAHSPFIGAGTWRRLTGTTDEAAFLKGPVHVGIDLSRRVDLTAMAYMAKGDDEVWNLRAKCFTPEDGLLDRAARDRVPYDQFVNDGWLEATPGASVDYAFVAYRLVELVDEYPVVSIAFDRWHIESLRREIELLEAPHVADLLVEFGQGFRSMAPAVDWFEGEVLNDRMRHDGNPVLTMCLLNVVAVSDPAGSRKLDKVKSTGRIDAAVAAIMAGGQAAQMPKPVPRRASVYEQWVV